MRVGREIVEKGEEKMTAAKQEKYNNVNEDELAKASSEINLDRLLQERSELWSRNWCPFCGKADCKSKIHFLKLFTLPLNAIPPKYAFLFKAVWFAAIFIVFILGKIIYLTFK